jgi:hypothetical protein
MRKGAAHMCSECAEVDASPLERGHASGLARLRLRLLRRRCHLLSLFQPRNEEETPIIHGREQPTAFSRFSKHP